MNEKTKYYYIRDDHNRPVVTVCEIEANGDRARGIAICSPRDSVSKERGKLIAHGRAVKAMIERRDSRPITRPSLIGFAGLYAYLPKSSFMQVDVCVPTPTLTDEQFTELAEVMP